MLAGLVSALMMPITADGPQVLLANEAWRIVFGGSIVMQVLVIVSVYLFFPNPSLFDELKSGNFETADSLIKKIYGVTDASLIRAELLKNIPDGAAESISLCTAFTDKQYRRAHWNSFILCWFQQFTAITVILIFAINIFEKMKKEG